MTEKNGTWGKAIEVPGTATLNTGKHMFVAEVSCVSPGMCSAAGDFHTSNHSQGVWVASQKGGTLGDGGTIPGLSGLATGGQAEVNGLSCATSGSCGLVGDYTTMTGSQQPFVVSGSVDAPTATTMALSAASVVYGHEQSRAGSPSTCDDVFGSVPTGTVTIKAGKHRRLHGPAEVGQGLVHGAGRQVRPRHHPPWPPSTAAASPSRHRSPFTQTFTVKKATTKTALGLSKSSVTFGKEQAERLSVAVAPQFGGTPAGTVTIKAGTRTVCAITLKVGQGVVPADREGTQARHVPADRELSG